MTKDIHSKMGDAHGDERISSRLLDPRISQLLQAVDPLDEQELLLMLEAGRSAEAVERIVSGPRLGRRSMPRRGRRSAPRGVLPRAPRRSWSRAMVQTRHTGRLLGLAGAVAAAAAVATALGPSPLSPAPVSAALSFSRQDGYIVARIVNPYAGVAELRKELARHGIDITLHLVAASPADVGRIVSAGDSNPQLGKIEVIQNGDCFADRCSQALRIPDDYAGEGEIYLGRPARAGERYESTPEAGSFAPGEALHCSGLLGATVADVLPALHAKGLEVVDWRVSGVSGISAGEAHIGSQPPAGYSGFHVWSVDPVAEGEVGLWLHAQPLDPALQRLKTTLQQGC